jgi:hypothetical protein
MSRLGYGSTCRIKTDDGGAAEVYRGDRGSVWIRWELAPPDQRRAVDSVGCMKTRHADLRAFAAALTAALKATERKPITRKRLPTSKAKRPPSSKPKNARGAAARAERERSGQ